ncbi:MAG: Ig-like domain-containing protein [Clostridiales bacterium]|jgi:hypothetical protein|nr:Ig-like domain-containing protein [Clostridiales bacterium]
MDLSWMKLQSTRAKIMAILVAAIIILGICIFFLTRHLSRDDHPLENLFLPVVVIAAEKDSAVGVELDSGFVISSADDISVAQIQNRLSIEPQAEYKLQQRGNKEVLLKPAAALQADTVYNILLTDVSYEPPLSWAFQTRNSFRVTGTFPADQGSYVPVDSGIELHFSQPVASIEEFVEIFPALNGRFTQFEDKIIVFLPEGGMEYNTKYTVTISAGLPGLGGETLGEDHKFSFLTESSTDGSRYYFYPYDGPSETFTVSDPINLKLYADETLADNDISVDIYRYDSLDDYLAALRSRLLDGNSFLPVSDLTRVADFSGRLIITRELFGNGGFLPLPENPGPGWYLVDMHTGAGSGTENKQAQKLLQITDITVYAQAANNQLLLWLNDASSGRAIAGADISAAGKSSKSDGDGVAVIDITPGADLLGVWGYTYSSDDEYIYDLREIRIDHNGQSFGEYLGAYDQGYISPKKLYYSYVYTDRAAYQPDDNVHFWGMILPRLSSAPRPEKIHLNWTDGGKYPDGIGIEVEADGSFRGELELKKHVSGWENLSFDLDGKVIAYTGITIMQYTKPVYTATIGLDKDYYRKDDQVQVLVNANFFDGTPAKELQFDISYGNHPHTVETTLRTDENGRIEKSFSPFIGSPWQPRHDYINIRTSGAEDQSIYVESFAWIFPSDYMLKPDINTNDDGLQLTLEAYSIDFDQVDRGEYINSYDIDDLRGAPAEMSGTATLHRVEYIPYKTGEYYDFIKKVVVERFSYERQETIMEEISINTGNGSFSSERLPYPKQERVYYYITLDLIAPDGSNLTDTCYEPWFNDYYFDSDNTYKRYYFRQDEEAPGNFDSYYYFGSNSGEYALDDPINIHLSDQNGSVPVAGSLLYSVLGTELQSWEVVNESSFSLKFLPPYIPNVLVVGAYFDGRHIFVVERANLSYRRQQSQLEIKLIPDKEQYRPGDTVNLQIEVSDLEGKGQAAGYLVSVADEAAFAVLDQQIDPLQSIYQENYIYCTQYASYIQPFDLNRGAEGGGDGGGDGVRRDFLDTVAFINGQTDPSGKASLSFKLADNITSWRLTGIAFTELDLAGINIPKIGHSIDNISVSLPFFINQVQNERYLEGDSIGLTLRGAGTAISNQDMVSYEVQISGKDTDQRKTSQSAAGTYSQLVFDPLPAGTYQVLIKAACGDYSDAIEKEIQVVESLLLVMRSQNGTLNEGLNIAAKRFPVNISFFDLDNQLFYQIIYSMFHSYGKRADQIIARAAAQKRLNEVDDSNSYNAILDIDPAEEGQWRYGLRLFPYAEVDPLLTAKALAVAGDFLHRPALTDYFTAIIKNKEAGAADVAAAYMGLAALKKPVLLDLQKLLAASDAGDYFSFEDKLYLATGLALLGDRAAASQWYEDNIHSLLKRDGNYMFISELANAHNDYKLSAAAAMLACLVNHEDHRYLLTYLCQNSSETYVPLLELATYINKYSPRPDSAASFSYRLAGKTIGHSFADQQHLDLELGETQLAESNFEVQEGNVGYSVYYSGGHDEAENTLPPGVSISYDLNTEQVVLGDLLRVTTTVKFADNAPACNYNISQIVPSGFRFVGVPDYNYRDNWYYQVGEAGMINFYIYPLWQNSDDFNRQKMPGSITFSYEARAVLPGTYIMEADAISYSGSNTLYATERRSITITE